MPCDLERIEVLKGPQGTLYGASSIGGLVKYVTVQPDTLEFKVRAGVEGFTIKDASGFGWGGQVYVNAPIATDRSEEHTSELQSLMRSSSAVFCLKKKNT